MDVEKIVSVSDPPQRRKVVAGVISSQKLAKTMMLFLLAGTSAYTLAQTSSDGQPSVPERVAALKASLQAGIAGQREYEWVETTVVSIKGDEKSSKQNRCYYATDGKLQKVPIPADSQSEGGRKPHGMRKRIAEKKKGNIEDAIKEAVALVKEYIPPAAERIQAAQEAGRISLTPQDSAGRLKLMITDYLKPGDTMTLNLDSARNALLGVEVATFMEKSKDTIALTVDLGALPDGTIYPATVVLDVKSQDLSINISNGEHKKLAP
jgi:hypothetical protein